MARDGKEVTELMQLGTKMLTKEDVMDGVADTPDRKNMYLMRSAQNGHVNLLKKHTGHRESFVVFL